MEKTIETVETINSRSSAYAATYSLQEVTDAWGRWMSQKYPNGGGVKYTESTNFSKQSSLDNYHQYQTNVVKSELIYDPLAPSPMPGMVSTAKTNFSNKSSLPQTVTYNQSETTTQSFSWSVTEALKLGIKTSVKAGLPAVCEVTTEGSVNIETSSTQTTTNTKTQTWSVTQPIVCSPNSYITARLNISTATYNIPWTAQTYLHGYVAIWFKKRFFMDNRTSDHYLYFFPIGSVIVDCVQNNLISTNGYMKIGAYDIIANSKGIFFGGQGTEMNIAIEETPLKSDHSFDETKNSNDYKIPFTKEGDQLLIHEG